MKKWKSRNEAKRQMLQWLDELDHKAFNCVGVYSEGRGCMLERLFEGGWEWNSNLVQEFERLFKVGAGRIVCSNDEYARTGNSQAKYVLRVTIESLPNDPEVDPSIAEFLKKSKEKVAEPVLI